MLDALNYVSTFIANWPSPLTQVFVGGGILFFNVRKCFFYVVRMALVCVASTFEGTLKTSFQLSRLFQYSDLFSWIYLLFIFVFQYSMTELV